MKPIFTILATAAVAATATWWWMDSSHPVTAAPSTPQKKVLFYQSAMHPWIKSDKPGRCTICGMELTPVYEGEAGLDSSGRGNLVTLTPSQIQVLNVQTSPVRTEPLTRTLRVAGMIDDDASRHRIISAYIDGRVDQLHVNFVGAEVVAGQPLADWYSPALLQAEREYRQLGGELKHAAGLRLIQMGLTQNQIDALNEKPEDSLRSQILAPISGTVVSRSVYEGQYVSTGQPLFEIADFSTMWFLFRAYEQDLPWLKPGLEVKVTTPSLPGRQVSGKIAFIDPNFDEATRSTSIRVELPNPLVDGRRELSHRVYADGEVSLEAPRVLSVPRSAVIRTGPEAVAYVDLKGGGYEPRRLGIGRIGDSNMEVLSGLESGENVVTQGNLLIDGQSEMNRTFSSAPVTTPPAATDAMAAAPPSQDPKPTMAAFLKLADSMAAALAADDLAAFNSASESAMDVTGTMLESLRGGSADLAALDQARHLHGFSDLKSARVAFHRFITAAVTVLEPLRKAGRTPEFQLYECGMVDEAIPNVPKKARWIQIDHRSKGNPFFGSEMPSCGKLITP